MQGIPRIMQTREDFDLALAAARAGAADRRAVASHYAGLIEAAKRYVFDRELAEGEQPDGEMPAYCVTEATEQDPKRRQLKLEIDPESRLFQLGYTVAEVEAVINELEGA